MTGGIAGIAVSNASTTAPGRIGRIAIALEGLRFFAGGDDCDRADRGGADHLAQE